MPQAARINDMHICPMLNPNGTPHVGGPILAPGIPTVFIEGMMAAVVGDMAQCAGAPDTITSGSATVNIGGKPAVRVGDTSSHGGSIIMGSARVNIGG